MNLINILITLLASTFLAVSAKAAIAPALTSIKVQPLLKKEISQKTNQLFDVMVLLTEQAPIDKAQTFSTKKAKAKFIYKQLTALAMSSQKPLVDWAQKNNLSYRQFYIMNMIYFEGLSLEQLNELSLRSDIQKIYTDQPLKLAPPIFDFMSPPTPFKLTVETSLTAVGADKVWSDFGVKGQNIIIAGQDTGIQWDHPALKAQYRGVAADGSVNHDYNWYDAIQKPVTGGSSCGYASAIPCDDNAHGTHTVGTIVGDDKVGNQIGMAPEAKWIGCRNMDAGTGRPHTYMACFEFFLAPYPVKGDPMKDGRPDLAPHIINNSWGCPDTEQCQGDVLLGVLQRLKAAGQFVVVSAGNDGPGCSTIKDTPAWHSDDTFSVGAYDHRRKTIAYFSSRGPSAFDNQIGPDVVAPGVSIRSSVPGNTYEGGSWSGTSMAGPHVVGLAALMWSANPKLVGKIDETTQIIRQTADPIASAGCMADGLSQVPNNTYGFGLINAYKAVEAAKKYQ